MRKWVEAGGVLLRFAGPHLAEQDDHLLPVRLRRGGRTIGGALSWEQPAKLAPFAPESPFAGLAIPADVTVSRQVLAEPDIDLSGKTWAALADGTPLVTAEKQGKGWIVLVHTTANAEWSNLALSGLFVEMLRRIAAISEGVAEAGDATLPPLETLDGFGRLQRAVPTVQPISAKDIGAAPEVLDDFAPGQIIVSPLESGSRLLRPLHAALTAHGISTTVFGQGGVVQLASDVRMRILYPPPDLIAGPADDRALVFQLEAGGSKVLLMSDSGFLPNTGCWITSRI